MEARLLRSGLSRIRVAACGGVCCQVLSPVHALSHPHLKAAPGPDLSLHKHDEEFHLEADQVPRVEAVPERQEQQRQALGQFFIPQELEAFEEVTGGGGRAAASPGRSAPRHPPCTPGGQRSSVVVVAGVRQRDGADKLSLFWGPC